jgi:hypothetical protein
VRSRLSPTPDAPSSAALAASASVTSSSHGTSAAATASPASAKFSQPTRTSVSASPCATTSNSSASQSHSCRRPTRVGRHSRVPELYHGCKLQITNDCLHEGVPAGRRRCRCSACPRSGRAARSVPRAGPSTKDPRGTRCASRACLHSSHDAQHHAGTGRRTTGPYRRGEARSNVGEVARPRVARSCSLQDGAGGVAKGA